MFYLRIVLRSCNALDRPPVLSRVPAARAPYYLAIVTRTSRCVCLPLGVCFRPSWRWCRAMVFHRKTSSTAAVANSSPTSSTPPNAAWTSLCVITRQSYARSPAVTHVPSKCLLKDPKDRLVTISLHHVQYVLTS